MSGGSCSDRSAWSLPQVKTLPHPEIAPGETRVPAARDLFCFVVNVGRAGRGEEQGASGVDPGVRPPFRMLPACSGICRIFPDASGLFRDPEGKTDGANRKPVPAGGAVRPFHRSKLPEPGAWGCGLPLPRNVRPERMSVPQERMNAPPERMNAPPERMNVPRGRTNALPERMSVPQARTNAPPERMSVPQARMNAPRERMSVPQERMDAP